jgi:Transposase domain (DUF772)
LFYEFSLERHIPTDHLLRSIDRFVEFGELRRELAPFYSTLGRPSIDPELMMRMLIVGYCFGIRSERRLCEEVHLNLAYRWFCRLGLDGCVPEKSLPAMCHDRSMKVPVTWHAKSQSLGKVGLRAGFVRRSRCCSRTSTHSQARSAPTTGPEWCTR